MNCPNCNAVMVEKEISGVKIDACENACKGIWFDNFEIEKLDENSEGAGSALEDLLNADRVDDSNRGKIDCPKCEIPLHMHRYRASQVSIDECYSCGGIFIDGGELKIIRENFKDDRKLKSFVELAMEEKGYSEKREGKFNKFFKFFK